MAQQTDHIGGINKTMTAVEYVIKQLNENGNWFGFAEEIQNILDKGIQMEKEQIKNAVMYGLDEDGHTGNWKLNVTENYYNKTYKNENN